MTYPDKQIKELENKAKQVRKTVIDIICKACSGHPGGSLSATDLVIALYFGMLRYDPRNPEWPDRDRFILSKVFSYWIAPNGPASQGKDAQDDKNIKSFKACSGKERALPVLSLTFTFHLIICRI